MVTDPQQKMFKRKGAFREYDSLRMYYVGMGGNYNSTTRMRRYDGKADLKIIGEYRDREHLLSPNKTYHIMMLVKDGLVKFIVDGQTFFSFKDDKPLSKGWFAIRSTKSRQVIDNVKIWQVD
jgi:rhamnogalacturonan endolyase